VTDGKEVGNTDSKNIKNKLQGDNQTLKLTFYLLTVSDVGK
jgi:hypothetical protein